MCIVCEMKKKQQPLEVIGTVSPQLLADWNAHLVAEGIADLDVDQMVLDARRAYLNGQIDDAEVEKHQAAVHEKQAADAEQFEADRKALWNRIYDEMGLVGLDRGMGYTISRKTGEVVKTPEERKNPLGMLGELIAGAAEVHVIKG